MAQTLNKSKTKVCYVLSYKSPDYIRTRALTAALSKISDIELSTAINSSKSVLRYMQTLWRLFKIRLVKHPDVYILGFRGQELYWPVRLLTVGKPLIFDEFINMHNWLGEENNKLSKWLIKIADWYETAVLKTCQLILTDTKLGTKSSSNTYRIPINKYRTIYVGADEKLFYPRKTDTSNQQLEVFFYGNMAPLHGITYVLAAAKRLKGSPIHFTIAGGKGKPRAIKNINDYIGKNGLSNITYKHWIDFSSLPEVIAACDVFLGGPFGNTSQSQRVITGKTFQALAMGKATIIGSINEDVGFIDKQNCLLVQQGSEQSLYETLTWALNNSSKLTKIGKQGSVLYSEKFSTAKITELLRGIIKSYAS